MDANLTLKVMQALQDKKTLSDKTTLRITQGAFAKMMMYAKVVSRMTSTVFAKMAHEGMECYGYLLAPADSIDDIITDIYFADAQECTSAYVRLTEEGVYHTGQDIAALGYKILGWWHSHGSMPPFHSGTDVNNFREVIKGITPITMFRNEQAPCVNDEQEHRIIIGDYTITAASTAQLGNLHAIKRVLQDPYAFSVVVNQHGQYYHERISQTRTETGFTLQSPTRPRVDIATVPNDITFRIGEIETDIFFKIKSHGRNARDILNEFNNKNTSIGNQHARLITAFTHAARAYLATRPQDALALNHFFHPDPAIPLAEQITQPTPPQTHIRDQLTNYFNTRRLPSTPHTTLDRAQYETIYFLQFMKAFATAHHAPAQQTTLVTTFTQKLATLETTFARVKQQARTMIDYADEHFTDYSNTSKHKYTRFMRAILNTLCTGTPHAIIDALNYLTHTTQPLKTTDNFFLYDDRRQILAQLLTQQMTPNSEEHLEVTTFLDTFPQAYTTHPETCDTLIEQHFIDSFASRPTPFYHNNDRVSAPQRRHSRIYSATIPEE